MKKGICFLICTLLITTIILPITTSVKIKNFNNSNQTPEIYNDYVPGEFVVKFKEGIDLVFSRSNNIIYTGIASIDDLNKDYKVYDIAGTFTNTIIKPKNPELFKSIGLDRIYTFKVDKDVNIFNAIKTYEKNPYIEAVDVSGFGHACIIPNDPHFGKQWGFHNTGQASGTPDADIDGPEGWDLQMGNGNIIVAIVDSGIDYNHQDLATRIWINRIEDINGNLVVDPSDFNGIDDDGNGYIDDLRGWNFILNNSNPMDDHYNSHGTHCAGIAGANTFNNVGVAGTLWSCQLMPLKAMYGNNGTIMWAHAAPAIIYAADNGAQVISMSFAGSSDNITLKAACDYAYASGCVLVAAIGNHGSSAPYIPAKYNSVIAVGATNRNDTRWSSSAYGSHISVVAPGVEIYSTMRNNQYGYMTGTSMATPMVAGLAGLIIAEYPSLTNADIKSLITLTAEDQVGNLTEDVLGFDNYYGYGRVNAYIALYAAPLKPQKPSGPPNGKPGTQYTYNTVAVDPNKDNLFYWWDWGDGTNSGWLGSYPSGQQVSASNIWNTGGTFSIKVKAKDVLGKESEWSDPLDVTIPRNKAIFNMVFLKFFERLILRFEAIKTLVKLT